MSAARMTVRAWTLGLRDALGELAAARLCWCLACGRVGLWGWRPLTPSMPITFVCTNRNGCRRRQAVREARRQRGVAPAPGVRRPGRPPGDRAGSATRLGPARPGFLVPRDRRRPAPALPQADPKEAARDPIQLRTHERRRAAESGP
jgi:hypothetical protein